MLRQLVDVERMAGVAHGGLLAVGLLQLAVAVDAEAGGRLLLAQPARHRHGRRQLRLQRRDGDAAAERVHQPGGDGVGLLAAAGLDDDAPGRGVDPDPGRAALREGARQQVVDDLLLHLLGRLALGAPAGLALGAVEVLVELALDHRAGNRLGLAAQPQQPLAADAFEQRAMRVAARARPAVRRRLRGAALDEARRGETLVQLGCGRRLPLGDAPDKGVFEHGDGRGWFEGGGL